MLLVSVAGIEARRGEVDGGLLCCTGLSLDDGTGWPDGRMGDWVTGRLDGRDGRLSRRLIG